MPKLPPTLSYTLRRLGVFAATLVLCAALLPAANFFVVLALAALISGVLSYFLLAGPRQAMAVSVAERARALGRRIDDSARSEDAAVDAARQAAVKATPQRAGNAPAGDSDRSAEDGPKVADDSYAASRTMADPGGRQDRDSHGGSGKRTG